MFKLVIFVSALVACCSAAPGVLLGAPVVTATSSQVVARNYNAAFAPVVASAPLVASAPVVTAHSAPLIAASPYAAYASPYAAYASPYAAYASPYAAYSSYPYAF